MSGYDANFVISGTTTGCHNYNLWCHHCEDKVGIMAVLGFQSYNYYTTNGECLVHLHNVWLHNK